MCVLAFQVSRTNHRQQSKGVLQADLEYWGIEDSVLETCCR